MQALREVRSLTDAVWLTPGYPWTEQPVGGLFFRTQAQALARSGLSVTVVAPVPWTPWPLGNLRRHWGQYARSPRLAHDGMVTVARPRFLNVPGQPSWAAPDRMLADAVRRARSDWMGARLVHGHSVVESLAAWRVAQSAGLPLVLTFHGSDMNVWPDAHPERREDLVRAVTRAAAVIAVSEALVQRIREVTSVTAVHLPIGSNLHALKAGSMSREEARRRLGLPADRFVALFVGNLLPAKGIRPFVDAVGGLGDPFTAVLAGAGPEAGYAPASDMRRVRYLGEQPHDEIVRLMCAADVLVLPSAREGLPSVIVEAGALGLPVIGSRVGGIPELLGGDRGILLDEVSAASIGAALTAAATDREGARLRAERLRDHVGLVYDVDRNAQRLIEIYRDAQGPASAGHGRTAT